jgi:hypothetical protein
VQLGDWRVLFCYCCSIKEVKGWRLKEQEQVSETDAEEERRRTEYVEAGRKPGVASRFSHFFSMSSTYSCMFLLARQAQITKVDDSVTE